MSHDHDHRHDLRYLAGGAQPKVFAASAGLTFDPPADQAGAEAAVREFLRRLSPALAAAGCVLVGHIKGVLAGDGDELEFSLTSLGGEPRFAGALRGSVGDAELTVNVIVFGVDAATLGAVVPDAWPHASVHAGWRGRPG